MPACFLMPWPGTAEAKLLLSYSCRANERTNRPEGDKLDDIPGELFEGIEVAFFVEGLHEILENIRNKEQLEKRVKEL